MSVILLLLFGSRATAGVVEVRRRDLGWEPPLREYFGLNESTSGPGVVQRVSNISIVDFARLARSGVPFVIVDGGRDSAMKRWNCEHMQNEFKDVRFRSEYGESEMNMDVLGSDWTRQKRPIRGRKLPPGAPKYAPFYSDVVKARKDEPERKWGKKKAASTMEKAIVEATEVPYFLHQDNIQEMKTNPEFWLQPPETGSLAHMDEHCIPTMATTLSGVKRWRLAAIPEKPHPKGYFDGLVYERDEWDPLFSFETRPGETVIFPPGMIHEGLSVGEDCVSSITYQFPFPAPVAYWRAFFPRIRRTLDMRNCLTQIQYWATLNDRSFRPKPYAEAVTHAKGVGKRIDSDSDSKLSIEEISKRMAGGPRSMMLDAWNYHDINGDGKVEVAEFVDNFAVWSAVEFKAQQDGVILRDPDEL
eukprot:CAMPEP_0172828436 /NCGR_PEP_ID=MMETSP1075-20121228/20842_1 /TAXON_ID=2916 /ORGANISM="Ceratium fusus, Strain PA161109" /LENGTH=415 /DNA_ID=CAMNT_0013670435 /DNA_START=42 /DNA_END=1289 /DNA_ORIENTATION=+